MSECYVTKRGYQLECGKPSHKQVGVKNGSFFRYVLFE